MPIYEYACQKCNCDFEEIVRNNQSASISCPKCQSKGVIKKVSAFGVKGSSVGKTCPPTCQKGTCSSCG